MEEKLGSRIILCTIVLAIGIGSFFGLQALKKPPKKKSKDALIKNLLVMPVEPQDIRVKVSGYGTVQPVKSVKISSEIKGEVIRCRKDLKAGELTKKGEVLAEVNDSDYQISLKSAIAETERLEALLEFKKQTIDDLKVEIETATKKDYELEKASFERTKLLFKKGVGNKADLEKAEQSVTQKHKAYITSQSLFERSKIELKTVQAQLDYAKAQKAQAELNIKRCKIRSPFDGRLEDVFIEDGEFVNVGQQLFEIADDSILEIPVTLGTSDALRMLDIGEHLKESKYKNWLTLPKEIPASIEWTSGRNKVTWQGKAVRIGKFDANTRTFTFVVRASKEQPEEIPLIAGMFCKVTFTGREIPNAVRIPWSAIQLDDNVFIVTPDNIAEEKSVKIFGTEGDNLIVTSGLKKGDRIVIQQVPRGIVNGTKVKPVGPGSDEDSTPDDETSPEPSAKPVNKNPKADS